MYRSLALAALLAVSSSPVLAQPTASLPSGFTFEDWLATGRTETVGVGDVNTRSTVFYVKEKLVAGFQSWYIFFDPAGTQTVRGSITFADDVAGVLTSTAELEVTEATYGLDAGITYGYRTATGLEIADDFSFSGNTLDFTFTASTPGDHIRVLTAAPTSVPEPGSLALLSLGVVGVVAAQRRRRTA